MNKHYCITGGIGAGKSYVCSVLKKRGISVYDCDSAAKRLMTESQEIKEKLVTLIGENAYQPDGRLNKTVITHFLLASESNKQAINAIVHPVVMRDFLDSGMQWMECAILYEARLEKYADVVIAVTAPHDVRVERIMKRDGINREKAEEWIKKQIEQDVVEEKADYVIVNDGVKSVEIQTDNILYRIRKEETYCNL